jgi:hypothetical protein
MKKFLLFLALAGLSGMNSLNAAVPCRNCKKDDAARNSDNNQVVSYQKNDGVATAARAGADKLSHSKLYHRHESQNRPGR